MSQPYSSISEASRAFKIINDPIHKHFELSELALAIIDTAEFQRLRLLKQLGTTCYVFPGAEHSRFQHSLGVYFLAKKQMEILRQRQPVLRVTERDVEMVSIAGLCHDLGHGPFSHAFEEWVNGNVRRVSSKKAAAAAEAATAAAASATAAAVARGAFASSPAPLPSSPAFYSTSSPSTSILPTHFEHEQMSLSILKRIIDKYEKVTISDEEYEFLACAISHSAPFSQQCVDSVRRRLGRDKLFMLEVVSNPSNSIDVDKFDYLLRDSYHTGKPCGFDPMRLMNNCLVMNGVLCYEKKEVYNIYELFRTRYSMFKQVYVHKVSKAIEYMIGDVMSAVDPILHISKSVDDVDAYVQWTDEVLSIITHLCNTHQLRLSDAGIRKANHLLNRLHRRDLYKCVFERNYSGSVDASNDSRPPQATDVCRGILNEVNQFNRLFKKYKEDKDDDLIDTSNDDDDDDDDAPFVDGFVNVDESDIRVQIMKLNYALGSSDPVENVYFYAKKRVEASTSSGSGASQTYSKPFRISRHEVSTLLPSNFIEYYVRVFVIDSSNRIKSNRIQKCAELYWQKLTKAGAAAATASSSSPSPAKRIKLDE